LEWAINNGVQRVYSVAAYVTERPFESPNVYCTTTTLALLEEAKSHGAVFLDNGLIGGENGIIMGLAKRKKVEGTCLLAETHGYQAPTGDYVIDPRAAKAALKVLTSMLNLKIDMDPMEKQVVEMDEAIAKLVEMERRIRAEMTASGKKPAYIT
jgi:proteasome assembly chaperone (PAC2) family protein